MPQETQYPRYHGYGNIGFDENPHDLLGITIVALTMLVGVIIAIGALLKRWLGKS